MAYEMTIKRESGMTFTNSRLEELTAQMATAAANSNNARDFANVVFARNLNTIDAEELYKEDGFKDVNDYAEKVCNMPYSTARMYIQVGRELNAGRLPELDANGKRFNLSQLRALAACKKTKSLTEAIESGELSAEVGEKKMTEKVRTINGAKARDVSEKLYHWEHVGFDEESEAYSKAAFIAEIKAHGMDFLAEFSADDDHYIIAIDSDGLPQLYRRSTQVKKATVEAEATTEE